MRRHSITLLIGLVLCSTPAASAQRTVTGQTLSSLREPAINITATAPFHYVGTQSFILYGIADAEQHFFVESEGGHIKRLIWIQFESMRANSTGKYGYETSPLIRGWGRDLRVDAYATITAAADSEPRPESDGARMRSFLRAKGLTFSRDVLMQRLVWVPDADKRREVMVIYTEDLTLPGIISADLRDGGRKRDQWPAIAAALQTRALQALSITDR